MKIVRVYKKGIIALPKDIRKKANIKEGMLLIVEASEDKIILKPLDLWERVWGCGKGLGSAEEAEKQLDEEEAVWEKRLEKLS